MPAQQDTGSNESRDKTGQEYVSPEESILSVHVYKGRIERLVAGWAVIPQWLEHWRLKPAT